MNAILNFATEFFEMLTKKQSEHPHQVFQVFQVFRVFQVFHFAFGPQNRPVLVQIRTKPQKTDTHPPPPCNGYGKHPKRQFTHLSTNTILYVL